MIDYNSEIILLKLFKLFNFLKCNLWWWVQWFVDKSFKSERDITSSNMPVECSGATNAGCLLNKLTYALFTRLCIIRDIHVSALSAVSTACLSNYLTYLNSIGRWWLSFCSPFPCLVSEKNIYIYKVLLV